MIFKVKDSVISPFISEVVSCFGSYYFQGSSYSLGLAKSALGESYMLEANLVYIAKQKILGNQELMIDAVFDDQMWVLRF